MSRVDADLLDRAERLAADCGAKGQFGMLARDDFPEGGVLIVPAALVSELAAMARQALPADVEGSTS